ncbi:hypothetical protein [Nitrospira sp. Nam74]
MGREKVFQTRADDETIAAIETMAQSMGMHRAELTRTLVRIAIGLKNPGVGEKFQELLRQHSRATWPALLEAAMEYYADQALAGRLDSQFHPIDGSGSGSPPSVDAKPTKTSSRPGTVIHKGHPSRRALA